jgi:hypothetical protein
MRRGSRRAYATAAALAAAEILQALLAFSVFGAGRNLKMQALSMVVGLGFIKFGAIAVEFAVWRAWPHLSVASMNSTLIPQRRGFAVVSKTPDHE